MTASADGMRCSECGRPYTAPSCGLLHAITGSNIAAIRLILTRMLGGKGAGRR